MWAGCSDKGDGGDWNQRASTARGDELKAPEDEMCGYLVIELGHGLFTTNGQSGCEVCGALDVAHLVVPIFELRVWVVRPLVR